MVIIGNPFFNNNINVLMGINYNAVQWNKNKKTYDIILWVFILFIMAFMMSLQVIFHPTITLETSIIRTTAITAFLLLHIILMIGPLCRLDQRFLPLLYNRRHLGVSMFFLALIHGLFCIIQFHSLGDVSPLVSLFTSNGDYDSFSDFPFQVLGFLALIILFIMAATSHDFWLKNLGPHMWKFLHMMVYFAYILIIVHILTGALQYESNSIYVLLIAVGFVSISSLHLYAGIKANKTDLTIVNSHNKSLHFVCTVEEIQDDCAKTFSYNNEDIAIFKYNDQLSAVSNICKHQMGPLGEGKIIDGCITCPWHGYQYLPENGQSPPPFNEKIKTYQLMLIENQIWVDVIPRPEGTTITPVKILQDGSR